MTGPRADTIIALVDVGRVGVVVELDGGGDPVQGTVTVAAGRPRAFVGWMDLIALLEEARGKDDDGASGGAAPDTREAAPHADGQKTWLLRLAGRSIARGRAAGMGVRGMRRRGVAVLLLAAAAGLGAAGTSQAQLVGVKGTVTGGTTSTTGPSATLTTSVAGTSTTTNVAIPVSPTTVTEAACELNSALCLLRSVTFKIVTEFRRPDGTTLRREHPGVVGVPNPVDADTVVGADLTLTASVADGGQRLVLQIDRLTTGPFPVAIEMFIADPTAGVDRRFGGGYDARESTAPQRFTATVIPAQRPVVEVAVQNPGPNLTILGDVFDVDEAGNPVDPLRARARLAPVPPRTTVSFETTQAADGSETTDADLAVTAPTRLDLHLEIHKGTGATVLDAFALITDTAHVRSTSTPVADVLVPDDKRIDLHVDRGGPIGAAGATLRKTEGGVAFETTDALLHDLPAVIDATVQPETTGAPLIVDVTPSGPIGMAQVALAKGTAPAFLGTSPYVLRHRTDSTEQTTVRVNGLRRAHAEIKAPDLLVDASLARQPLIVDIEEPDLVLDGTVNDLPEEVDLDLRPDEGELHYDGSAVIDALGLTLRKPSGLRTSTRTGVVADELDVQVQGVPTSVDADLVPADGAPLTVEVGPTPLSAATVRLSDDLAADGLTPPAGGVDGAIVRDLPDRNALLARLTRMREARLIGTQDVLDVLVRADTPPDMAVDVEQVPETAGGEREQITASIQDRPDCLRFALTAENPGAQCEDRAEQGPDPPVPGQTHIRYEGETGAIRASALNMGALDGKDLHVDLAGTPGILDAEIRPAPGDRPPAIDVRTTDGDLAEAEVRLTTGPTDDELPAGRQGVLTRNVPGDRDVVLARLTQLDRAIARFDPQLDVVLSTLSGDGLTVDTLARPDGQPEQRVRARVESPPDCLRLRAGRLSHIGASCDSAGPDITQSGATNITLQSSQRIPAILVDELRGLPDFPEGRTLRVTLDDVPTLLAASLQGQGEALDRLRVQTRGAALGFADIEFAGRDAESGPVLDGHDGIFLSDSGDAATRLVARLARLNSADVTMSPLDVELRTTDANDVDVDILRKGAGPEGVDQHITGRLARVPACLRLQVRAPTDGIPAPGCEQPDRSAVYLTNGLNVGYQASGVPAGGSDVDLTATGLPDLDERARLTVDLDGVPSELLAGLFLGSGEQAGEVQHVRAQSAPGAPLQSADIRLDVADDLPAAGALGDRDGLAITSAGDDLALHASIHRLEALDARPTPLDVGLRAADPDDATIDLDLGGQGPDGTDLEVDALLTDLPDCLRLQAGRPVPGGACGRSAVAGTFFDAEGATNIGYVADGVPDGGTGVDLTLAGIEGLDPRGRLHAVLTGVPAQVGAALLAPADGGLQEIRGRAGGAGVGSAFVGLDVGDPGEGALDPARDGVHLRLLESGVLRAQTRVTGLRSVAVDVQPLDVSLESAGGRQAEVTFRRDVPIVLPGRPPIRLGTRTESIDVAASRTPPCLAFSLHEDSSASPLPADTPCGAFQALTPLPGSTDIAFRSDAVIPAVDVDVSGLEAFPAASALRLDLNSVPTRVTASLSNDAEGLDRIRASAGAEQIGLTRVAFSQRMDVTEILNDAGGRDRVPADGAFVSIPNSDPPSLGFVTRAAGVRLADAELRPLDILLDGEGGRRVDLDLDVTTEDDQGDPQRVAVTGDITARPDCLRFAVSEVLHEPRCDTTLRDGYQLADHANVIAEAVGAQDADATVQIDEVPGLPADHALSFDLTDIGNGFAAAIAADERETREPATVTNPVPPFETIDIEDVRREGRLSLHATTLDDGVGPQGALGQGVVRLQTGATAQEIDDAAINGLAIDLFEDAANASPDTGVFARVHQFRQFDLDRTTNDRQGELDGQPIPDFLFPTSSDSTTDIHASTAPEDRRFEVKASVEGDDGGAGTVDARIADVPSILDATFRLQKPEREATRLLVDYEATDDVEAAAGEVAADVEVRNLGGESTDVDITPIPRTAELCAVSGEHDETNVDAAPDFAGQVRCDLQLLTVDGSEDEELLTTARLNLSEEALINVDRCEQRGEQRGDCSIKDGDDTLLGDGPDGAKAVRFTNLRVTDLRFQMGVGWKSKGDRDGQGLQDRISVLGLETPLTSPISADHLEVIDHDQPVLGTRALFGSLGPTVARTRTVGMEGFLDGVTPKVRSAPTWSSGRLECGEGTDLQAMMFIFDIEVALHPALCTETS